jgi:hypothetical protein
LFYNIAGLLNSGLVLVSLLGLYAQLRTIRKRKKITSTESTELLSLNQSLVSYFAYLSFFIYGFSISPFNHYLVWPRLAASVMTFIIIFEIWQARKNAKASFFLAIAAVALLSSIILMVTSSEINDDGKLISTGLIVLVTLSLAQGYAHQIYLIIKHGRTGAVDIRLSQSILLKDFSTALLVFSMGYKEHWPLLFLATVSGITKIIIMYLFRWVRISSTAKLRAELLQT